METRRLKVDYLRALGLPEKCVGGKIIARKLLEDDGREKIYTIVVRLPKKDDKKRPKNEAWILTCTVKKLDDCVLVYPDSKEKEVIATLARKNERKKFVICE
jgi:hypothetical protein